MATFRAMTWNVENFFPAGTAAGPKTQAEYEAKVTSLATVIDAQRPDVLAMQEVGDTDVLGDLQDALTHKLPESSVSDRFDADHAIRVAFLSRLAIDDPRQIHDLAHGLDPVQVADAEDAGAMMGTLLRGALQISVDTPLGAITLGTAHLKSKLLSFPEGFEPHDEDEHGR